MTFTTVPTGTKVVWSTTVEMAIPVGTAFATHWISRPVISHVFGRILRACAADLETSRTPDTSQRSTGSAR